MALDDNISAFSTRRAENVYSVSVAQGLTPPERYCLSLVPPDRRGSVLDLGVGAGRTTGPLAAVFSSYLGIDYSPRLVEAAKRAHPTADLRTMDARELADVNAFDCVFFSYNGIDNIGYDDRIRLFGSILRSLKPGGFFIYSTHSTTWHRTRQTLESFFVRELFDSLGGFIVGFPRRLSRFRQQYEDPDGRYLILNSVGLRFRLMQMYVDVDRECRILEQIGFTILTKVGNKKTAPGFDPDDAWVYIAGRKD